MLATPRSLRVPGESQGWGVGMTVRKRAAEGRKKMGRPRAVPGVGGENPRAEILDAAARLFTQFGYTKTTTREIAEAVGLRPGSLFHYFPRKQDILHELLNLTIEPAIATAAWLENVEASPDVKLFLLVKQDVANLCSLPHNLGMLYFQPEIRSEEFAKLWENREKLRQMYADLIEAGVQGGYFHVTTIDVATNVVFGLVESTCTWFEGDGSDSLDEISQAIARAALQILLPSQDFLERVLGDVEAATHASGNSV